MSKQLLIPFLLWWLLTTSSWASGKQRKATETQGVACDIYNCFWQTVSGNDTRVTCDCSETSTQLSCFWSSLWSARNFCASTVMSPSTVISVDGNGGILISEHSLSLASHQKQFVVSVWGQAKIYVWLFLLDVKESYVQNYEIWNWPWTNMWKD